MHPTSVFAAATARLHADLIVTRLKRAGISSGKISAAFPEESRPNSVECWLEGESPIASYEGENVLVAGPLRKKLSIDSEAHLIRSLQKLGLSLHDACAHAERLSKGQIVLSVQTDDQAEIALAWHIFRELEAEGISLGLSAHAPETKTWFGRRTQESSTHAPGLTYGMAI